MQNAKLRTLLNLDGKLSNNLDGKLLHNLPAGTKLRCNSRRGGFTLIEVIVTLAIVSISLVMVMQLFSSGLRVSRTSCDYTRAIVHAKGKMEELSHTPVQDSGKFEDGFEWESEVQPHETLNVELEDAKFNILNIKVKISWHTAGNKKKSVELVSLKTVVEGEND